MISQNNPGISIAMCTCNGELFLLEQLESIAKQTVLPDELIICDDQSSDGTLKIIQDFQRKVLFNIRIYSNNSKLGPTKNFEKAISLCHENIIVLSDQDDVWFPNKLEKMIRVFKEQSKAGYLFSDAMIVDEKLQNSSFTIWKKISFDFRQRKDYGQGQQLKVLLKHNIVTGAMMAFRAELRKLILPIPEQWIHDAWIALLLSAADIKGAFIEEPLIKYRQHSNQLIGIRALSFNEQIQKTYLNKIDYYELLAKSFENVVNRLTLMDRLSANTELLIQSKIHHLQIRQMIHKAQYWQRWHWIFKEIVNNRYNCFSNGWKSVAKDLFFIFKEEKNCKLNRKIKVVHIIARMITGGADENTLFTMEGLDENKYEVDLITGEEFDESILNKVRNNHFDIIQIKGLKWKLNFLHDPIVLLKLIKLLKNKHYDIVHTHTTKAGILGRIAARIAGVPVIIHGLHGSTFEAFDSGLLNWLLFLFERLTGRFTDAYISVSRVLSERYIEKGIGKKENYYTVYSGMDLETFYGVREKIDCREKRRELGISLEDFLIGNVARLETRKGHKFLIDALKKVIEERKGCPLKLLIIGEGEERRNLENYVKDANLEKKVIFTGYREDVEELMAIMDIFVLTSLREGLPRVLVQAAVVGVPSVAFNVDGVPEIIQDNYNGFLVKAGDVKQLTKRIMQYIDYKELLVLHGKNGRELIIGKWSIEDMVGKIDEIYQNLIREKLGEIG